MSVFHVGPAAARGTALWRAIVMDTAVGLVQAYLNVNGYLSVVEYPVLEAARGSTAQSVTDLDVLAVRFSGAGHEVIRQRGHRPMGERAFEPDPALGCPTDRPDMIIGEVKEGQARFNAATRDVEVLQVALARFGCCRPRHAPELARTLLATGRAEAPGGHLLRMVAFGAAAQAEQDRHWHTVPMDQIVRFLRGYLREHWAVLKHAQLKDSTVGLLALLEKFGDHAAEPAPRRRAPRAVLGRRPVKRETH